MSGTNEQPASSGGEWVHAAVRRFEGSLLLYATRLSGDRERGRDIVQETFLQLCAQVRSEVEPRLAEWLYTVCRNRALDQRRKEKRMRPMSTMEHVRSADLGLTPPEVLERKESKAEALQALEQLPGNQQEVLRLKFQHGLSYQEISRITELSVGNVGYLIHMGLKAIRERMNDSGTGFPACVSQSSKVIPPATAN